MIYPDLAFGAGKTVMQTLRLPLEHLRARGVAPANLRAIALEFDRRLSGTLYLGDIQITD